MGQAWNKSSFRKLKNDLLKCGYCLNRTRGSHFIYINKEIGKEVIINRNLNKMVERRIRKEVGLL